jgi:hypothetical protein
VAIGVISYWLIVFSLAARFLPFKGDEHHHGDDHGVAAHTEPAAAD